MNTLGLFILRELPTGKYLSGRHLYLDSLLGELNSRVAVYNSQKNAERSAKNTLRNYLDHVAKVVDRFDTVGTESKKYWQQEIDRKIDGIEVIPLEFRLLKPVNTVRTDAI
jgi:hypothetical protein